MPFSYRMKVHLGKQEESNKLPNVSKTGKKAMGLTFIKTHYVKTDLLHTLTSSNLCNDPPRSIYQDHI